MDLPDDSAAFAACLRRISRWRVPPNWTFPEWSREIRAHSAAAFVQACRDFDACRHVPFDAFARQRVLTAALTRYRQEWAFARRCQSCGNGDPKVGIPGSVVCSDRRHLTREILTHLSPAGAHLIAELFWNGETEATIAAHSSMTQQAVSKRKMAVLRDLRKLLAPHAPITRSSR